MTATRDTIPRVQHVAYFQSALSGIAEGETFDALRLRIRQVSNELSRRRGDSPAASRVADEFTVWSPTKDSINELMLLGLVERRPLPSKRVHVDAHREMTYTLTALGHEIINKAGGSDASLRGELTPLLIQQHPYLSSLCDALAEEPLLAPEYTEEDLKTFRQDDGSPVELLAADAADRMRRSMPKAEVTTGSVAAQIRLALKRRFPHGATPTAKDLLDTTNDALAVSALEGRGLRFDAITFNVLTNWGRQLFIFDESRYVHARVGRSVWATADVSTGEGGVRVGRRGLSAYGDRVAEELAATYRDLADAMSEEMGGHAVKFPYIEIFRVRALTAFRLRVSAALVDRVVAEIASGERAAPFRLELQLGTSNWPSSEPAFKLGSRRYYVVLIKSEGEEL
jgi:hypothetical protein